MWYSDINKKGAFSEKNNYDGCPITDAALVPLDETECREMCIAEGEKCGCWDWSEQWTMECNLFVPYDGVAVNWNTYKDSSHGEAWSGLGEYQANREPPTSSPTPLIQYCTGANCPKREMAKCNEEVFGEKYCVTMSVEGQIYRYRSCNTLPENQDVVPLNDGECRDLCHSHGKECGCWDFGHNYNKCSLYPNHDGGVHEWTTDSGPSKNLYWAGLGEYQEEE